MLTEISETVCLTICVSECLSLGVGDNTKRIEFTVEFGMYAEKEVAAAAVREYLQNGQ